MKHVSVPLLLLSLTACEPMLGSEEVHTDHSFVQEVRTPAEVMSEFATAMAGNRISSEILAARQEAINRLAPQLADAYLASDDWDADRAYKNVEQMVKKAMFAGAHKGPRELLAAMATEFEERDSDSYAAWCTGMKNRFELATGDATIELKGKTVDGADFDIAQHFQKGQEKVVLVDFLASWCGPCLRAIPEIKQLHSKYHEQGFEVVAVSLDDQQAGAESVASGKPWPTLWSARRHPAFAKYQVDSVPTMFLIGRDGKAVSVGAYGRLESLVTAEMSKRASK